MTVAEQSADRCFVDSNIWLYALIVGQDIDKSSIANALIRSNEIVISTQVINEVCINLIKKANFDEMAIQGLIGSFFSRYAVTETNQQSLLKASLLRNQHHFSFWDSVIVASALEGNATILFSEDMTHGQKIEGQLTIINPFMSRSEINL